MLIFGYIISNGDEAPVLPDAIDSLASGIAASFFAIVTTLKIFFLVASF